MQSIGVSQPLKPTLIYAHFLAEEEDEQNSS